MTRFFFWSCILLRFEIKSFPSSILGVITIYSSTDFIVVLFQFYLSSTQDIAIVAKMDYFCFHLALFVVKSRPDDLTIEGEMVIGQLSKL